MVATDILRDLSSITQSAELLAGRNFALIDKSRLPRRSGIYKRASGGITINHLTGYDNQVRIATLVVDLQGAELDPGKPKFMFSVSEGTERVQNNQAVVLFDRDATHVETPIGSIGIVTPQDIANLERVIAAAL